MSLKFIALSGTVSVTENLYVYEYEDQMMVVDCGVGFPDLEMHGVDLVIPDFSYIIENKSKLKGIIVSQGHEDHIGALPFLLRDISAEIWAAPLVAEFVKDKFKEYDVASRKINTFNPDGGSFKVGIFEIHPFRVTHSVPDTVGFAIDTPQGRVFHVPEHKMDQNPVDRMPFDVDRAKFLAGKGLLFLASDCLGANKPGFTKGERHIEENIFKIVTKAEKSVFFTAISSNIGRFQQAVNVAERSDRKVIFIGRSVQKKCEIAHGLGYLRYKNGTVISIRESYNYSPRKLMYVISGCYGQVGSSLYRLSLGEHEKIEIEKGDTLIFSADPAPPYSKESEDFVIDNFIDIGVDVHYYDLNEDLYVSGHGSQEDIMELFRIVNPRYFIPIGGAIRYMHSYKNLALKFGASEAQVFQLKPGENVIFDKGVAIRGKRVSAKEILVHGLGIGDVGKIVLSDRDILGKEGFVVAVLKFDMKGNLSGDPKIVSRGFVFEKVSKNLLYGAEKKLKASISALKKSDEGKMKRVATDMLEKFFFEQTGRRPMVLPVVVEV